AAHWPGAGTSEARTSSSSRRARARTMRGPSSSPSTPNARNASTSRISIPAREARPARSIVDPASESDSSSSETIPATTTVPKSTPRPTITWREARRAWRCSAGPRPTGSTRQRDCASGAGSPMLEHPHQEVVRGGAEVPGGEALGELEAGRGGVGREVLDRVAAVEPEPDHQATLRREMRGQRRERRPALRPREEGQHIARTHREVEQLALTVAIDQVELREVPHLPAPVLLLGARNLDQVRIEVDADDLMPGSRQSPADPPRAAPGIEDPRAAPRHGVDQPRLAVQVLSGRGEALPACGVAGRMLRVAPHRGRPQVLVRADARGRHDPIFGPVLRRTRASRPGSGPRAPRACPRR